MLSVIIVRSMTTVLPLKGPQGAREILDGVLRRRVRKNPGYSLRSLARSLGVSHSLLSLVLAGKRPVSRKLARRLVSEMTLSPEENRTILEDLHNGSARGQHTPSVYRDLSLDQFSVVSEWYHFAILSLLELPGARFNPLWIARQLKITPDQARTAMRRLTRMGFVAKVNGQWRQCTPPLKLDNKISTLATRRYHRQILEKAITSLETDSLEVRDVSGFVFAMNPEAIPYAVERIRQFRRDLGEELEKMGTATAVYHLAVQLFPLTLPKERT
ncbi:MAG: TIGR02147 family protein [Deltaproteobacteria bacterium]|nr:TIGR02147 family protein [Deltaproteobacteria bacterium]MBI3293353.1 TIGR02147 family protein [Deltaproteobacteria bacterium]